MPLLEGVELLDISRDDSAITVQITLRVYKTKALLFATGAERRNLDVPGEERLRGKGLIHCATCDGFLFRGKTVAVIGGATPLSLTLSS